MNVLQQDRGNLVLGIVSRTTLKGRRGEVLELGKGTAHDGLKRNSRHGEVMLLDRGSKILTLDMAGAVSTLLRMPCETAVVLQQTSKAGVGLHENGESAVWLKQAMTVAWADIARGTLHHRRYAIGRELLQLGKRSGLRRGGGDCGGGGGRGSSGGGGGLGGGHGRKLR